MNFHDYVIRASVLNDMLVIEHDKQGEGPTCLVTSTTKPLDLGDFAELASKHDATCPWVERA